MNLIEQLGGYEKAKEIAFDPLHPQMTHVSNDGRHWVNEEFSYIPEIRDQIQNMIRIEDVRKALLEYRRQHNIFEVRDFVKSKKWIDGSIHKIELVDSEDRTLKIFSHDMGFSYWVDSRNYQHATDAEIKENKRLEGL